MTSRGLILDANGYHETTDRGTLRFMQQSEIDEDMREIPGMGSTSAHRGSSSKTGRIRRSALALVASVVVILVIAGALAFA